MGRKCGLIVSMTTSLKTWGKLLQNPVLNTQRGMNLGFQSVPV
jgi:hypothetical protein